MVSKASDRALSIFLIVLAFGLALFGNFAEPADMLRPQSYPPSLVVTVAFVAALAALLDFFKQRRLEPLPMTPIFEGEGMYGISASARVRPLDRLLGLLGWLIAAVGGLFALPGKFFARRGSGGRNGQGKTQSQSGPGLVLILMILGCLALLVGIAARETAPLVAAMLLIGLAAAIRYHPALLGVVKLDRRPRLYDLGVLVLCLGTVFTAIGAADTLARTIRSLSWITNIDLAGNLLLAVGSLLVALPLAHATMGVQIDSAIQRPIWPLGAALLGGGLALIFGWMAWSSFVAIFDRYDLSWVKAAQSVTGLAGFGLLTGAGFLAWFQAASRDPAKGFDWPRVFTHSIRLWALLIGLAMAANLMIWPLLGAGQSGRQFSIVSGAICVGLSCFSWLVALRRFTGFEPGSPLRILIGWAVLCLLFPITIALSNLIAGADDWGPVLFIFTLPVALAVWLFTAAAVPRLLGWILGEGPTSFNSMQ